MKARRRSVARARGFAWAGLALCAAATGALSGCNEPFPGVYQECPASNACADTRAPNSVGPDGPRKLYEGDDPVAAARALDLAPIWAREGGQPAGRPVDRPEATCDEGRAGAAAAAPASVRSCLSTALDQGKSVNVGWYVSTVEGDPIVTLGRAEGDTLRIVEVTAFDNYGGVNAGPLPEYVCSDVAGFLRSPGIPTEGSSNPGKCARGE